MSGASTSAPGITRSVTPNRVWRIAGAAFCMLMLLVHVAAALNSAGFTDFWRDVYWATLIAHGERFPLSGPPINRILELGPWWFYLLALPLWLTGRVVAVAVFIQLIAAAKYFLAWRLGLRLVDARFGLACAVSLAFVGWSTASLCFPSHPAVAETCVLLLGFVVLRGWRRFAAVDAVLLGLASAACLHAHPTTLLYVAMAGGALLYRHRPWHTLGLLAVSLAIVLLSLLPPWLDSAPVFVGARKPLEDYWQKDFGANIFARIPRMLLGLYFGGAWNGFLTMTLWNTTIARLVWYVYCVCLAFAAAGAVLQRQRALRRVFVGALAFVVAQIVFLALVRAHTPIWMVPSCLPAAALGLAIGWYGWLASASRTRVAAGGAMLALYAVLSLAPFGVFLRELHSVRVMPHANPLFNMSESEDEYQTVPVPVTSIRSLDMLGSELCKPVTLHARLAAATENGFAIPARNACGRWPELQFAGTQGAYHLAGISTPAADAIGIAPDRVVGHMALYTRVRAVAPAQGAAVAHLERMQVAIEPPSRTAGPVEFDFDAAPGDVIALTNRFPQIAPLLVDSVIANDAPAKLLFIEGKGFIYACGSCDSNSALMHWHLHGTGVEQNLDLIVLSQPR